MDGGSRGGSNPAEVERPAEKPIPTVARRVVLWRRLDEPAFDHCRLVEFAEGYALEGTVLTVLDDQPARIHYGVFCGHDWLTRHAHAAVVQGTVARQIQFRRDERNRWWRDDVHVPALDGVLDTDPGAARLRHSSRWTRRASSSATAISGSGSLPGRRTADHDESRHVAALGGLGGPRAAAAGAPRRRSEHDSNGEGIS